MLSFTLRRRSTSIDVGCYHSLFVVVPFLLPFCFLCRLRLECLHHGLVEGIVALFEFFVVFLAFFLSLLFVCLQIFVFRCTFLHQPPRRRFFLACMRIQQRHGFHALQRIYFLRVFLCLFFLGS